MALHVGTKNGNPVYFKPPAREPLSPVQEFAKENIGILEQEEYYEFEDNLKDFLEDHECDWDEIHQTLLEEAINDNDMDVIRYLVNRMSEVCFLKPVDIEKKGNWPVPDKISRFDHSWGDLSTPLMCNDPDIMRELFRLNKGRLLVPQHVMWTDGKKICLKVMSLEEAAMASNDMEIYDLILEHTGARGWVDPEYIYLSDDADTIGKYLKDSFGIETDSEAMYWMSEAGSLIAAEEIDDPKRYDIRKILKAANPVFLAKYLMAYPEIDRVVLESWRSELRLANNLRLTVEMFRDQCDVHECCCLPYDRQWMTQRINACQRILDEYSAGTRAFYEPDDDNNGWYGWDEE